MNIFEQFIVALARHHLYNEPCSFKRLPYSKVQSYAYARDIVLAHLSVAL